MSENPQVGKSKHTPWDNKTSKSWLHGIEYQLLEDPDDIYDYVNIAIRKELETDLKSMGDRRESNEIIESLSKRKWRLEIVNLIDIQLNPMITESYDVNTGKKFSDRLKERTTELCRVLDHDRAVIWPLVLVDNPPLLVDGHCRHSALTQMGISRAYGYLGLISKPPSSINKGTISS